MKENEDDIEKMFRDRFSNEEAPISPRVWDAVKKTLPAEEVQKPGGFPKRFMLLGIAGTIVLGGIAYWLLATDKTSATELVLSTNPRNNSVGNTSINTTGIEEKDGSHTIGLSVNPSNESAEKTLEDKIITSNKNDIAGNAKVNKSLEVTSNNENRVNTVNGNDKSIVNSNSTNNQSENNTQSKFKESTTAFVATQNVKAINMNKGGKNQTRTSTSANTNSRIENKNVSVNSVNAISSENETGNKKMAKAIENGSNQVVDRNDNVTIIPTLTNGNQNLNHTKSQNSTTETGKNNSTDIVSINDNRTNKKNPDLGKVNSTRSDADKSSLRDSANQTNSALLQDSLTVATNQQFPKLFSSTKIDSSKQNINPVLLANIKSDSSLVIPKDSLATTKKEENKPDSSVTAKKEKKRINPWSVDLFISPSLTGALTKGMGADFSDRVKVKNQQDHASFGFGFGAHVNYLVSNRISLSTGLIYSSYNETYKFSSSEIRDTTLYTVGPKLLEKTVFDSVNNIQKVVPYWGIGVDTSFTTYQKKHISKKQDHYSTLSIPLNLSYKFFQKSKVSLTSTIGIRANLLVGSSSTYIVDTTGLLLEKIDKGFAKMTFAYSLGLGMEYALKEKVSLFVQPTFVSFINSVHQKSSGISQKPYSLGLAMGVRITF